MGISLTYTDQFRMTLECDASTGMFCCGSESFDHSDGYIGTHAAAMSKGWVERQGSQGRLWLCPECSGKH